MAATTEKHLFHAGVRKANKNDKEENITYVPRSIHFLGMVLFIGKPIGKVYEIWKDSDLSHQITIR